MLKKTVYVYPVSAHSGMGRPGAPLKGETEGGGG